MKRAPVIQSIMQAFAVRTGLTSAEVPPARYLWTDAFAVCNFLELFRRTDDSHYLQHALDLIEQVHQILGKHRDDDPRHGWISGLDETEGAKHPTRGGLRIGKRLPERKREEPFDERLEWDRDGQYYHYLTKWMHALDRAARVTRDSKYTRWAHALAKAAHAAFVHQLPAGDGKRMFWKMSVDLSYPLVSSMGHHDPLDGLVTYQQIQVTGEQLGLPAVDSELSVEIADMKAMCEGVSWQTGDTLGIGCLLIDACRLARFIGESNVHESSRLNLLLDEAAVSLAALERKSPLSEPVGHRLAFRELGLSIGLHCLEHVSSLLERSPEVFSERKVLLDTLSKLAYFHPWIDAIESFWLEPCNQQTENWLAHVDINAVMLATSLAKRFDA